MKTTNELRISGLLLSIVAVMSFNQSTLGQDISALKAAGTLIVNDDFEREQVGKNWAANDERAQRTSNTPKSEFKSQLQISDHALRIVRTQGSDHAATSRTDAKFKDAIFELKFRLNGKDKFNLNTSDPNCKTVHAGHIWSVQITPNFVLIQDQKTGTMDLKIRELRTSGQDKQRLAKLLDGKSRKVNTMIEPGKWHDLQVLQLGESIIVNIDQQEIAKFSSPGIGHLTKERVALSVPGTLEVDDIKVWRIQPAAPTAASNH